MRHACRFMVLMFAGAAATAAAGCASTPLHTESTTSGIRAAQEGGAANVPQAALHLQLAKEQLKAAEGLSKKGEKEQAASMLSRAEADAALALALSHEEDQKSKSRAALERVRQLQQDNR